MKPLGSSLPAWRLLHFSAIERDRVMTKCARLRREASCLPTYVGLFKSTDQGVEEIRDTPHPPHTRGYRHLN
jgi:hypothetical protein